MTGPTITISLPAPAGFVAETLMAVTRAWFEQGYEAATIDQADGGLIVSAGEVGHE